MYRVVPLICDEFLDIAASGHMVRPWMHPRAVTQWVVCMALWWSFLHEENCALVVEQGVWGINCYPILLLEPFPW